jgi:hypothetical protein
VLLALNRRAPFLPLSVLDLLRAHAHLGLGGFFLTLLQGATFQLVPMFTMADVCRPRWIAAGLCLTQLGLFALAPGLAWNSRLLTAAGGLLVTAGIGCSGEALVATLRSRRRRVLDPALKAFSAGAGVLAVAAVGGLVLVMLPGGTSWAGRGGTAYGMTIIAGALSFMILGMLCKIVPFLVWMKAYGPRAGRQPVPQATALGSRVLEHAWIATHGVALLILGAAVVAGSERLAATGAIALAAAAAVFLANIARVGRHLFPSNTSVATVPRTRETPAA